MSDETTAQTPFDQITPDDFSRVDLAQHSEVEARLAVEGQVGASPNADPIAADSVAVEAVASDCAQLDGAPVEDVVSTDASASEPTIVTEDAPVQETVSGVSPIECVITPTVPIEPIVTDAVAIEPISVTEDPSFVDDPALAFSTSHPDGSELSPTPIAPPVTAAIIRPPMNSGGWTIPILCAGLALLAAAVIIPQTEDNRRLVYEREKLKVDLERVDRQITTNDEFLRKIAADATLAERLAQRQMKMIRQGTSVLELKGSGTDEMSPFQLVNVPAAEPLPPYQPVGGILGRAFSSRRMSLYLIGAGLMMTAFGLVMGSGPMSRIRNAAVSLTA